MAMTIIVMKIRTNRNDRNRTVFPVLRRPAGGLHGTIVRALGDAEVTDGKTGRAILKPWRLQRKLK